MGRHRHSEAGHWQQSRGLQRATQLASLAWLASRCTANRPTFLKEFARPVLEALTPRQHCSACSTALLPLPLVPLTKVTCCSKGQAVGGRQARGGGWRRASVCSSSKPQGDTAST
jgi:hypothetical protein